MDCPILFLTAKTTENDITFGLGLGADDYLTKPFRIAELRARVNAHLRREHRERHTALAFDRIKFDLSAKELRVDNTPVALTKSEYLICEAHFEKFQQDKRRTGHSKNSILISALLLLLAGISDIDIYADYEILLSFWFNCRDMITFEPVKDLFVRLVRHHQSCQALYVLVGLIALGNISIENGLDKATISATCSFHPMTK